MRLSYLLAVAPFVILALPKAENPLDRHTATLQGAQSLVVKFKVNTVGGDVEEQELFLSANGKLKWNTPTKTILSDGKTAIVFDKKAKNYTQEPYSKMWARTTLKDDRLWAWLAFQNPDFGKDVTSSKVGDSRKIGTVTLTDVTVTRMRKPNLTVMINPTSGVSFGSTWEEKDGTRVIVQATDLKVDSKPLDDSLFAWSAPAGVTEKPVATTTPVLYADIKGILDGSCGACHGSNNPKAGLDFSTYESIMSSKTVKPGDPDNSRMIRAIVRGKMPPRNPMPDAPTEKLVQWVKDGAKQ